MDFVSKAWTWKLYQPSRAPTSLEENASQQHKAFRKGRFWIQDLGSQLISRLVAPAPNHRVLDACAGAGGKKFISTQRIPQTGPQRLGCRCQATGKPEEAT